MNNKNGSRLLLQGLLVTTCAGIALLLPLNVHGQGALAPTGSVSARTIAGRAYTPPTATRMFNPGYPADLRRDSFEGWVELTMMVDDRGRAREVAVRDSSGPDALEALAVAAMDKGTFEPATLNGKRINSVHGYVVTFMLSDSGRPSREFVELVNAAGHAQKSGDRVRADEAYLQLEPRTIAERLLVDTQRQSYYKLWGTPGEELDVRTHAVKHATLLTMSANQALPYMRELFELQIRLKHYGDGLKTLEKLRKVRVDQSFLDSHQASIENIAKLRTDDRSFAVEGELIDRTSWFHTLLKRKFRINVSSGQISQLQLRCERDFVFQRFEPGKQYETSSDNGTCELHVIGDRNTKFELVQS
jgi:TonB family protein